MDRFGNTDTLADMRSNALNLTALCGVGALFAGCLSDSPDGPRDPVVVDSAGVAFVTSSVEMALAPPPIRFSAQPLVRMTGPFHEVSSVEVLSDRIFVADEFENEIRAYDLEGLVLSRSGGKGDGPDEFPRTPHLLRDQADGTFLAYDGAAKKALRYDPNSGSLSFISSFPDVHRAVGARGPVAASGGHLMFVSIDLDERAMMSDDEGPMAMPERVASVDVRTGELKILAEYNSPIFYRHNGVLDLIPFAPRPEVTASPHGALVLVPGLPELREYDRLGQLRRVIRLDASRDPVTPDALSQYTQFRDNIGGAASVAPDSIPFFDRVLVDTADRIWARRYAIDLSQTAKWLVFGDDGMALGAVEVPADLELMSVGFGLAAGIVEDDFGGQSVVVFGLEGTR